MNGPFGRVLRAHATVSTRTGAWVFSWYAVGEVAMERDRRYDRYREFQSYVGWTEADAVRMVTAAPLIESPLVALVDDFYAETDRHDDARKVVTGGQAQVQRLKGTLVQWLREL